MNNTYQSLYEFIDSAEKSRNYPENTADALKAALRLFESELQDEEKDSLETFKNHLEQIYSSVFNKNKSKYTIATLETYKRRIKSLLNDYDKYAHDPSKMASWDRKPRVVKRNKNSSSFAKQTEDNRNLNEDQMKPSSTLTRFELPLRADVKAIILTPSDLTKDDVKKLRGYIDYLDVLAK